MEIYQKINSVGNNMHNIFPVINFIVLFRFFIILSYIHYSNNGGKWSLKIPIKNICGEQ